MAGKASSRGPLRSLGIRARADLVGELERIAEQNGRSIAMECEMRLAASLAPAPDLRTLIREEIRAALAERNDGLMNAALAMVRDTPVPPEVYRY